MKDSRCFVCKFKQVFKPKTCDDLIYDARGNSTTIPLCYGHSVELFKNGQKNFLTKHHQIFTGSLGIENDMKLVNFFNNERKDRPWY
jgi:hypothetical protein